MKLEDIKKNISKEEFEQAQLIRKKKYVPYFDKNKENRLNTQVNNLFFAFQNNTLSIYRIHFASKNVNATHHRNNSFYYENPSFAKKYF